ncbi:MAG: DUF3037 domain-containing protein, partial [Actinomycetota bacterium]|nr:DUF3037 domain-containing protein [Actinomycetota bacterium]
MNRSMTGPLLPFQYVVLRCVPRVDREEFLNLGVVLYSQAADYLCCASQLIDARLLALAPDLDLDSVQSALDTVAAICQGDPRLGAAAATSRGQRFGWLAAPKSTMV